MNKTEQNKTVTITTEPITVQERLSDTLNIRDPIGLCVTSRPNSTAQICMPMY